MQVLAKCRWNWDEGKEFQTYPTLSRFFAIRVTTRMLTTYDWLMNVCGWRSLITYKLRYPSRQSQTLSCNSRTTFLVCCGNLEIQCISENCTFLKILHNYGKLLEILKLKNIFCNRQLNKSTACRLIIKHALATQVSALWTTIKICEMKLRARGRKAATRYVADNDTP